MKPIGQTEFKIFTKHDKEWRVIKNATLYNFFTYSRNDFVLIECNGKYQICVSKDGELYALWYHFKNEGKDTYSPGEILSLFRKGFSQSGCDSKSIESFLKNPKRYVNKRKKELSTQI